MNRRELAAFITSSGIWLNQIHPANSQSATQCLPDAPTPPLPDPILSPPVWKTPDFGIYLDTTSVKQGKSVQVFIHATPPQKVDLKIFNAANTAVPIATYPIEAKSQCTRSRSYRFGAGWTSPFMLDIAKEWPSGLYSAELFSGGKSLNAKTYFVVRTSVPGSTSKTLLLWPFSTAQAYNSWGGRSLYWGVGDPVASPVVSFLRPYVLRDDNDKSVAGIAQALPLFKWLKREGLEIEHCSSLDLHFDSSLLEGYRLLVLAGHDEYWSHSMRSSASSFLDANGNLAVFSGNTCWWQVRFDMNPDGLTMSCWRNVAGVDAEHYPNEDKGFDPIYNDGTNRNHLATVEWFRVPRLGTSFVSEGDRCSLYSLRPSKSTDDPDARWPETELTNVSFRFGFIGKAPGRQSYQLTLEADRHWVFEGTSLLPGKEFGGEGSEISENWEVDGGVPGLGGTSRSFKPLARGKIQPFWEVQNPCGVLSEATIGIAVNKGTVFSAPSNHWATGLVSGQTDPGVNAVTRNVLTRLGAPRLLKSAKLSNHGWLATYSDGRLESAELPEKFEAPRWHLEYDASDPIEKLLLTEGELFVALRSGMITRSTISNLEIAPTPDRSNVVYDVPLPQTRQAVRAWELWKDGLLTLFDGGGLYFSRDRRNLGGGGETGDPVFYSDKPRLENFWIADDFIYSVFDDNSCFRTKDPKSMRQERVYDGSQLALEVLSVADGGVVTFFDGGGAYFSRTGKNIGGGKGATRLFGLDKYVVTALAKTQTGVLLGTKSSIEADKSRNLILSYDDTKSLQSGLPTVRSKPQNDWAKLLYATNLGIICAFNEGPVFLSKDVSGFGSKKNSKLLYAPR